MCLSNLLKTIQINWNVMLESLEKVPVICTLGFPKGLANTMDRHKTRALLLIVGLDPFCTGYDPDGIIIEPGKPDILGINKHCSFIDKLQSKWSQPTTNTQAEIHV